MGQAEDIQEFDQAVQSAVDWGTSQGLTAPDPAGTSEVLDLDAPPESFEGPDPMAASLAQAEWQLRRLRRVLGRKAEVDDTLAEMVQWHRSELAPLEEEEVRLRTWLTAWMLVRLERDPTAPKTCRLPSGQLKSQAGSARIDVEDAPSLIAWAAANDLGFAVRVPQPPPPPPPAPDKNAIRQAIGSRLAVTGDQDKPGSYQLVDTKTGEPVPGVFFVRSERSVVVDPLG